MQRYSLRCPFLLAISAMIAISAIGFSKGNPSTLIPTSEFANQVENKSEYWFQDAVAIMKRDTDVLAGGLALAFVLAVGWIQLMRYFTKLFIYLTLVVGLLAVIGAGVFFLHLGVQKGSSSLKITSYAIFGIALLLLVVLFFLRSKIALTSALFSECCKGFQHNPSILLVGISIFFVLAVFTAYWISQFIYLYSIPDGTVQIPNAPSQLTRRFEISCTSKYSSISGSLLFFLPSSKSPSPAGWPHGTSLEIWMDIAQTLDHLLSDLSLPDSLSHLDLWLWELFF